MKRVQTLIYLVLVVFVLNSCKTESNKQPSESQPIQQKEETINPVGDYVSADYFKRKEGYDWVAVSVKKAGKNELYVSIRSRADKKKPTCTFDTRVYQLDQNTYVTDLDGAKLHFKFKNDSVSIFTEKEEDMNKLYFYCSGGATLAGSFVKILEKLDDSQIDKTQYTKTLSLQNVGFNISSIAKNGVNQLTVSSFGLINEFNETYTIQNQIVSNAEVEDMNADGSPELLIYTHSATGKKKAFVYAFSVNKLKSMSQVYFQPIEENKAINSGYDGNDEFGLVEQNLIQRFPVVYNGKATGKIKQISYQLVDGEASRRFVVKKQIEF